MAVLGAAPRASTASERDTGYQQFIPLPLFNPAGCTQALPTHTTALTSKAGQQSRQLDDQPLYPGSKFRGHTLKVPGPEARVASGSADTPTTGFSQGQAEPNFSLKPEASPKTRGCGCILKPAPWYPGAIGSSLALEGGR
ncbi:hypothetical protein E5288_WYG008193 [Bos mutus]|uniref:Uncharacterized protein n=1 Tax=Bos mutus TaxID=72004 RepID=A0A6B0RXD5_9CETA|nr:hypothetical protein [Bos mutus]